jgi:uncharacterized protein YecE (DUF72 family)
MQAETNRMSIDEAAPAAEGAYIGISGWRYAPWRADFYPDGLPQKNELAYAAARFNTIELNGSFYSLQRPESYARWYSEVPAGFVFAIKGSRYITHMLRLRGIETALANLFASGLFELREKLGPFLWQLPPTLPFDAERLAAFFELLPRTGSQAAKLARRHDSRVRGAKRVGRTRRANGSSLGRGRCQDRGRRGGRASLAAAESRIAAARRRI